MTADLAPAVRARHMKSLLAALGEVAEVAAAELDPVQRAAIEEASGLEWLPFEANLTLTRAIYHRLGEAEAGAFFRRHTVAALGGPLLRGIVDAAVRLFGLDPGSWARWVPRGWEQVFRRVGTWSVATIPAGEARLALEDLPASALLDGCWPGSVASSLGALCDLARCQGGARLTVDAAHRRLEFQLRWQPKP